MIPGLRPLRHHPAHDKTHIQRTSSCQLQLNGAYTGNEAGALGSKHACAKQIQKYVIPTVAKPNCTASEGGIRVSSSDHVRDRSCKLAFKGKHTHLAR